MQNLTNEQKAQAYNNLLHQYQRLQEQVRQIKAEEVNISDANQRKVNEATHHGEYSL